MVRNRILILAAGLVVVSPVHADTKLLTTTAMGDANSTLAGMAVDQIGNRYLAIARQNVRDIPSAPLLTGDPTRGVAVQKIGLDGAVLYTAWLPGINDVASPKITVSKAGEVYLAGITRSEYVTPTPGAIAQRVLGQRGFVLKLNAAGDRIDTAAVLDVGLNPVTIARITLDSSQNIYLALSGVTPGLGSIAFANFVLKLNPGASEVLLNSQVTDANETLSDFVLDAADNIYVAGGASPSAMGSPYMRDLVSRDGGNGWTLSNESSLTDLEGRSGRIAIHPTDPATIFENGQGGVFRSNDGGINWSKLGVGLEPYFTERLFIHPAKPELMFALVTPVPDAPSVFRSEDAGATWSPVSSERSITRVVFDPQDSSYVYLDNPLALIRSKDGGLTFDRVNSTVAGPTGTVSTNASNLTASPTPGAALYGYTRFGLSRSDDHGNTWRLLYSGCGTCPVLPVFPDVRDPLTLSAAGSVFGATSGIAVSTDGGATWKLTSNQGQFDSSSLRRSDSNPTVFFASIQGRMMRTYDGGANWTRLAGLTERARPISFEVSPSDGSVTYATYRRGGDLFVRKLDPTAGQILFTGIAGGFGGESVTRIDVDNTGRIYVVGITDSIDFPTDSPVPEGDTNDTYVIAFDPGNIEPIYTRRVGGVGQTLPADMSVDCSGTVTLAATTSTPDFPLTADAIQADFRGVTDILLIQLDRTGATTYASYFGGAGSDGGRSVAVDSTGRIYLAGFTASSSLPGLPQLQAGQNTFTSILSGSSQPSCSASPKASSN